MATQAGYNPYRFLDPASQNTTGRGGAGTSRGGVTYLGGAPVPQSVAPADGTRLAPSRRRQGISQGSLVTGMDGSGSMGRRMPVQSSGQRTPTFQNADAYFTARGSGLDWLERYGPNRGARTGLDLGGATYGGRAVGTVPITNAAGTRTRAGNQVIDFSTGQNLDADNPYTALTGDTVGGPVVDSSPEGRFNRMGLEQEALAAAGLEEGRAAARQVSQLQDAASVPALTQTTTPTGVGRSGVGRFGVGTVYPYGGGPSRSFGPYGSSSPDQMRQDELGERAIARRNRAGVSTQSLLESGRRRFQ